MATLVIGATGATGRLVVQQLLDRNIKVRAMVRSAERFGKMVDLENPNLTVVEASIVDVSDSELNKHVAECNSVVQCLGHNITFKGMYMPPRRLCRDSAKRLSKAIDAAETKKKLVVMSTVGARLPGEGYTLGERVIVALLRALLPPHVDNEATAAFLRKKLGQSSEYVEWTAVRPDDLIDEDPTAYVLHGHPTKTILNSDVTSRANVAQFMCDLITDSELWEEWKFKFPCVYNKEQKSK